MGAHNFLDLANAKTATLAYESAVSQAQYEEGHDPYNGTISTTNGFIELPESYFKGLRRPTRLRILEALALGDAIGVRSLPSQKAKQAYANLSQRFRGTDKWGRCYALRLNHNTFAFAGWAAS